MKQRTGFVSNSSSSSFILYGRDMHTPELVQVLLEKDADGFKQLTGCEDQQAGEDKFDEDWDGEIAGVFHKLFPEVAIDDYPGEDGNYMVGLQTNPEYLSLNQIVSGIWTQEQIDIIDKFFEGTSFEPSVDGGTKYC